MPVTIRGGIKLVWKGQLMMSLCNAWH